MRLKSFKCESYLFKANRKTGDYFWQLKLKKKKNSETRPKIVRHKIDRLGQTKWEFFNEQYHR